MNSEWRFQRSKTFSVLLTVLLLPFPLPSSWKKNSFNSLCLSIRSSTMLSSPPIPVSCKEQRERIDFVRTSLFRSV